MVKFKYVGSSGRRIIGRFVWDAENNFVTEVDAETAADLIAYPRADFEAVGKVSAADAKAIAEETGLSVDDVKAAFSAEGEEK